MESLADAMTGDFKTIGVQLDFGKGLVPPDLSDQDKKIEVNNSALLSNAVLAMLALVSVCMVICLTLYFVGPYDIKGILISNLILLVFIGCTEFYYVSFVTKSYQSLDPNEIKLYMLTRIKTL
jgi:hypothetical protein